MQDKGHDANSKYAGLGGLDIDHWAASVTYNLLLLCLDTPAFQDEII